MLPEERDYMRAAIEEARKCSAEDSRIHPRVGAVVVRDGRIVAKAFRGELRAGEHAEYTALERKAVDETLVGSTVYTTLEPCTRRNKPKVACAERLIERKVSRVVIGMLDPNPQIRGTGQLRLRDANIATELFPQDLMAEIEELNREFIRAHREADDHQEKPAPDESPSVARHEQNDVLAGIDDRIRVVSHLQFEPASRNLQTTYWLIGPITIENHRDSSVSLDGYLEASHSTGPARFDVDGVAFRHWEEAMRTTHQASVAQLMFPLNIAAHSTNRGIALIRFPKSELGGFGRFQEKGQTIRFVLTLSESSTYWSTRLRLPYEWNPQPTPTFSFPGRKS